MGWRAAHRARTPPRGSASIISRARSIGCCWCRMRRRACHGGRRLGQAAGRPRRSGTPRVSPSGCRRAASSGASLRRRDATQTRASVSPTERTASSAIVPGQGRSARAALERSAECGSGLRRARRPRRSRWRATGSIPRPPTWAPPELAAAARAAGRAPRRAVIGEWVGEELLTGNFPAIHAVGRASAQAPRLIEIRWSPPGAREPRAAAARADRQGRVLRQRRSRHQAGLGHGADEEGHGRGGRRARARPHAHGRRHSSAAPHPRPGGRELPSAATPTGPATCYRRARASASRSGTPDAEGRLVLCDALAFADADQPDLIIDFATLDRAPRASPWDRSCRRCSAPMSGWSPTSRAPPPRSTTRCGRCRCGWATTMSSAARSPTSTTSPRRGLAGAIFGALFLKRFVTATPHWLHLDLYAWNPEGASRTRRRGRGAARCAASTAIYCNATGRCEHEEENQSSPQGAARSERGPPIRRRYSRLVVDGVKQAPGARHAACCRLRRMPTSTSRRSASPRPGAI